MKHLEAELSFEDWHYSQVKSEIDNNPYYKCGHEKHERLAYIAGYTKGKTGEWVSCKDRMPPNGDYSVLVAFTNGSVEDMRMAHVHDWHCGLIDKNINVTHWMPRPAPPAGA